MSKWIPDRKVWAGGLTMVLAWLIVQALNVYAGADIPIEITAGLAFALGKAVEYFVPQPAKELIAKIDNDIVAAAGQSPASEVSATVGAAAGRAIAEEVLAPTAVAVGKVAVSEFDAMMARIKGGR